MKILLTGCNGQVGFELQRSLAPLGEVIAFDRPRCDLADPESLRAAIREVRPNIMLNPAAYTAVDKAEGDEVTAQAVNGDAPGIIGEEAAKIGALVIHYSTDYVFDGTKTGAYVETDATNPLSVYGRTKLAGENALIASEAHHLIFRTSWVFGAHGANFLKTILRLAREREELRIVGDQFGAPTGAALIADTTAQVLGQYLRVGYSDSFPFGTYHLTASGCASWHEYAAFVVEQALKMGTSLQAIPEKIHQIATADYPLPATRPQNSRLDCSRLEHGFQLQMPTWQNGVSHALGLILK
jgi:dTDP-4-dehydrorhamnose reductase